MKRSILPIILLFLLVISVLENCKKAELPPNPYDGVEYGDTTLVVDTLSPHSFVKLHKEILMPSCNVLGCHDGSFEPDFRNVQSSYNTLVYHDIIKNNLQEEFTYRVVPYDTGLSVLHERLTNCCFVNTNDRMPQDNIGNGLSDESIAIVSNWILNGAKDIAGEVPVMPNSLPNVLFFSVTDSIYDSTYSDNRPGAWYNPFTLPNNALVNFIFRVTDDQTPAGNMQVNNLLLSPLMDDFSASISTTAVNYNSQYDVWIVPFHTSVLQSNQQYYMRYEVNDGQNNENTIYPNNMTSYIYKSIWSFTVQ